jgi:hypothetical protein
MQIDETGGFIGPVRPVQREASSALDCLTFLEDFLGDRA